MIKEKNYEGKKKQRFCPHENCNYSTSYARHYFYHMNRAYIKDKNTWKAIGWYCKRCNTFIPDKEQEEGELYNDILKKPFTDPDLI